MDTTRVDDGIVEGDGPAVRLGGKFRSTIDAVEYGSGEIPFPVVLFYIVAPPALPELLPVKETSLFSVKEMPTLELAHMAPPFPLAVLSSKEMVSFF